MNYVEHQAVVFKRKNHIRKCNFKRLLCVCRKKGYMVKSYSKGKNFMLATGLWRKSQCVPSISVVDEYGNAMIFLRDGLSGEKRLFALAHELGHIILKHKDHSEDYAEEEANQFAHSLLQEWRIQQTEWILTIIIFLLSLLVILFINDIINLSIKQNLQTSTINSETNEEICYFTKYGEVYHIYRDCHYLKNSKEICTGTTNTCYKDRMCSACEYRKNN